MKKSLHVFILAVFISFLTGCSSIPLSTMLKMSSFDEVDLLEIEPHHLQARISLSTPYVINTEKSEITLRLSSDKGEQLFVFPLRMDATQLIPSEEGWLSSTPEHRQFYMSLTEKGLSDFRSLQDSINVKAKNSFHLSINTGVKVPESENLSDVDEESSVQFSVDLKLIEDDEFFTLIKWTPLSDV